MNTNAMFTDETVDIQVTDTTKIVSMTFENEQMVEKEVALADLKAADDNNNNAISARKQSLCRWYW